MNKDVETRLLQQFIEHKSEVVIRTLDGRKTRCIIDEMDDVSILVRVHKVDDTLESHLLYKNAISSIIL